MPKLKTKSSAKKRFSLTATGKVKRQHAFKRHNLRQKTQKMKRQRRGTTMAAPADAKKIREHFLHQ